MHVLSFEQEAVAAAEAGAAEEAQDVIPPKREQRGYPLMINYFSYSVLVSFAILLINNIAKQNAVEFISILLFLQP